MNNEAAQSNLDEQEYIFCRYRRCGKKVLDAHAYGLKAWRFPKRRTKKGQ